MSQLPILPSKQQGAVLIVSLMLLIVLTMLGVSVINSTKLETRMAANSNELNHAFQVAEVGIAAPRNYISDQIIAIAEGTPGTDVVTNIIRDDNSHYWVEYTTARVQNIYPDNNGMYDNSVKMLYFHTKSIGYSRSSSEDSTQPDTTSPYVILESGMVQPIPINNKILTTTE